MGMAGSSMIVRKINLAHVLSFDAEGQTKVSRHPNAPPAAPAALKRVQPPTWEFPDLLDVARLLDRMGRI